MKTILALLLMTGSISSTGRSGTVKFDDVQPGKTMPGWTFTKTGDGDPKWSIERDDSAPSKPNVLKQSGEATYPVALKDDTNLKDGFVEVKFKAVSGKEDQAAGVIWRAKDASSYYVARANALEDNVTIYHTIKGKRTEKKRAKIKVPPNQWHTLRVEFAANRFHVLFNGNKALEFEDDTFANAGKVGLWTKADSVTVFDDFSFGSDK
jgi:hypothetical protein